MASVMIVDAERLSEMPKAFQQYVADYFVEKTILDKRVYVATCFLDLHDWRYNARGNAPTHNVHLRCYTEGLKDGQSLNAWISKAVKTGKYVWDLAGGHDSDSVVNVD